MIKNIFFPDTINNYYLFSKRFIGISIKKTKITATKVTASGTSIAIQKTLQQDFDLELNTHNERVISALVELKPQCLNSNVITAIDSSIVVFKELTLPFTTHQQISQVVGFEVEPLLPFTRTDAVIDFIITKIDHDHNNATILVAAVQKNHIAEHLSLFEQAGISPDIITIDMFALYHLYQIIPSYASLPNLSVLIEIKQNNTNIVVINNGNLHSIRNLSYGTNLIAKTLSNSTDMNQQQAHTYLMRANTLKEDTTHKGVALNNSLSDYAAKINFDIASMVRKIAEKPTIQTILLLGNGSHITDLPDLITQTSKAECSLFEAKKITENPYFNITASNDIDISSLAIAIPPTLDNVCNFRKDEFENTSTTTLLQQIISAGLLILFLTVSLIAHITIQTQILQQELKKSEQEALEVLQERFPRLSDDESLDETLEQAEELLKEEQLVWGAYSNQSRAQFLEYLLELTTHINKLELGFIPEQLTITDGVQGEIMLKAKVRDFEALKKLEESLRQSKLFIVEGQKDPDFNMKILIRRQGI